MIVLIGGSTHTGKTTLAQKLVDHYHYFCMSLDHLKMGLIRSGMTELTPCDDDKMTDFLWPIVKEIIKTAIENKQNLIIEGCYIPNNWKNSFEPEYVSLIRAVYLIMTPAYIENHFEDIKKYSSISEFREDEESYSKEMLLRDNQACYENCLAYGCEMIEINDQYEVDLEIQ